MRHDDWIEEARRTKVDEEGFSAADLMIMQRLRDKGACIYRLRPGSWRKDRTWRIKLEDDWQARAALMGMVHTGLFACQTAALFARDSHGEVFLVDDRRVPYGHHVGNAYPVDAYPVYSSQFWPNHNVVAMLHDAHRGSRRITTEENKS